MAVEAVSSSSAGSGTTSLTSGAVNTSEFLQLLVTQIKNQDPFSPMSNEQFMSQLTQLSSLEQLQNINGQLQQNLVYTQSLNNTMLLDLVGRQATVKGEDVSVADGAASRTQVIAGTGGTATVQVKDATGQVVASYQRAIKSGWNDVTWDGKLTDGSAAADGDYTVSVSVVDRAGTAVASETYASGAVESIRFENNIAIVRIHGHDYYVSDIAQISR